MQDLTSHNPYQGSTFQKYSNDYDDEPYEMVQEPYELSRYPTVDDISGQNQPDVPTERKKEPSSPTFHNNQSTTVHAPHTVSTSRANSNREAEFTKQMTQKIKRQAEQLHELGNYRLLCEKRILELAPGHPLPVQPSHLGHPNKGNYQMAELQEILKAKEEEILYLQSQVQNQSRLGSARKDTDQSKREDTFGSPGRAIGGGSMGGDDVVGSYNILYGKYKALLSEKQALEESLRSETLTNEEQRTYVEILRKMLDEKFDQMNITQWFGNLPERGKIDALMEIRSLNDKLAQQQNLVQNYQSNMQAKNMEIQKLMDEMNKMHQKSEELINENIRLSEAHIKSSQVSKSLEGEIKNLEEEKSNLIDFAEEQANKAEEIQNNYNELKERYDAIDQASHEIAEKLQHSEAQILSLQNEIKRLMDENVGLGDRSEELQQQLEELLDEKKSMTHRQKDIEDKLMTGEQELRTNQEELKKLRNESADFGRHKASKDKEAEGLRRQLDELVGEHNKLQDLYKKKEAEFQDKCYQMRNEFEAEINRLEEQNGILEENENNLKAIVEKNNNEISKVLKQLNNLKDQNKKLEKELHTLRNLQNSLEIENSELRDTLDHQEKFYLTQEEDNMKSAREMANFREESEKNYMRATELSNMNSTLEKRLADKEKEIREYESLINESKKRGERDRQAKLDEVKRLYDENNELRRETHQQKDHFGKLTTSLSLKEEEVTMLKNHLDKKTQQIRVLTEENRLFKQKAEDLDYIQEQLGMIRNENDVAKRELRDFEDQIEDKSNTLKNTMTKLETTEHELFDTLSNLKDLQRERADLIAENARLQKKIEEFKGDKENMHSERAVQEDKILQLMKDNDRAQKNLARVSKDLEELSSDYNKLTDEVGTTREEEKSYRTVVMQVVDMSKNMLNKVKQYVTVYNEMLVTSPDALIILGKRFRTLLETFDVYQFSKDKQDGRSVLVKATDYIGEIMSVLLEESENLGRRVIDLKQDLLIGNQRVVMLERKCMNLTNDEAEIKQREGELRRELETLREEKFLIQKDKSNVYTREVRVEKENTELKREVAKLEFELKDLRNNLRNMDQENSRLQTTIVRKNDHQELRGQDATLLEERYKVIQKEKKSYEEILQKLCNLFANPELQKLIMDIIKLQSEVDQAEREKYNIEVRLGEMEMEYKLYIKKASNNLSPTKSSARRSEIDNARSDLNNMTSQISILRKRKNILLEELRSFEIYEKKRYETTIETEKSLVEARRQLQELKSQNTGLERANVGLKDAVKTITKERQVLDNENMKLKYSNYDESSSQDHTRTYKNNKYNTQEDTLETYEEMDDGNVRRSIRVEGYPADSQRVPTGISEIQAEQDTWDRGYGDKNRQDMYSGFIEKKDTSYSRFLEHDNSQQRMKLKDRLNQAKSTLSGLRKSYREEAQ